MNYNSDIKLNFASLCNVFWPQKEEIEIENVMRKELLGEKTWDMGR